MLTNSLSAELLNTHGIRSLFVNNSGKQTMTRSETPQRQLLNSYTTVTMIRQVFNRLSILYVILDAMFRSDFEAQGIDTDDPPLYLSGALISSAATNPSFFILHYSTVNINNSNCNSPNIAKLDNLLYFDDDAYSRIFLLSGYAFRRPRILVEPDTACILG